MLTKTSFEIQAFLTPGLNRVREALFMEFLGETAENLELKYAPDPVGISREYLAGIDRLCPILDHALRQIVSAYFKDERIREIYQLDSELESILKFAESVPYQTGFYRPDFLYDLDSTAKICEIGARYPLNGWMISYYQNLIYEKLYEQSAISFTPIPAQNRLMDELVGMWDNSQPVTLVHDAEKGTEIFILKRELIRAGVSFLDVKPQDLELKNGEIVFGEQVLNQFILEMDREELKKFKPEVLEQLIRKSTHVNDVRTLILVHDKRVLAVLWNEEIMRDYLDEADYAFLRTYLIPSFVIKNEEEVGNFLQSPQNQILKLNSGGRGIGAYVKNECEQGVWETVLRNEWKNYLVQDFVDQEKYEIDNSVQHLVGLVLCANGKHFGPGVFRGSGESVVNVHQGRAKIFPVLFRDEKP